MTTYNTQDLSKITSSIKKAVKSISKLSIDPTGDFYMVLTTSAPKTVDGILKIVRKVVEKYVFEHDLEVITIEEDTKVICGSIYRTKMHQAFDKFADEKLKAEKEEVKIVAKIEGIEVPKPAPVKSKKAAKSTPVIEKVAEEATPKAAKSKKETKKSTTKSAKKETGADISRTKPGVKDFIFAILHCQVGITRANILKSLIERFPERSADSMANTVKALLSTGERCRLAKERNANIVFVQRDNEVYFRVQTETEEAPKPNKTTKNKK